MLKLNKNRIITTLVIAVILVSCAKIVAPTGGPKDLTPPILVHSTPGLKSTNFKGKEVIITFNKFIQPLKDANNQVIISPPPEKQPEMKLKGKSIVIKFLEDLKANSTYNIYFGDAIQDLHESNIKKNFYFTFSTGDKLDTLELRGRVNNAETGLPEKDIFVELYKGTADSIPIKERPFYVGKSNVSGDFTLKYLANMSYKLFALKDANSNLKYDLPTEAIAFDDKPVFPDKPLPDSIDSVKRINTPTYHHLALFLETDSVQRVEKKTLTDRKKINFVFRYGVKNLDLKALNFKLDDWNFKEWNKGRDTLNCWFTKPLPDTLQLTIKADNMKLDTLQFYQKIVKPTTVKKTAAKDANREKVELRSISFQGTVQPYDKPLIFETVSPVNENKLSNLRLIRGKDTARVNAVWADTISHRRFIIDQKWREKSAYSLLIPSGKLTDIFGLKNDSVDIHFTTMEERDYGSIIMSANIMSKTGQWICQLLNEKDGFVRQSILNKSGDFRFELLTPAKYKLKFIFDANSNGVWDTGNYLKHRQAEKVILYDKTLEVRPFFEDKETIELKPD